jgi:hypothetical protein
MEPKQGDPCKFEWHEEEEKLFEQWPKKEGEGGGQSKDRIMVYCWRLLPTTKKLMTDIKKEIRADYFTINKYGNGYAIVFHWNHK